MEKPTVVGKIPPEILEKIVFKHLGSRDPDVVLEPSYGEDSSATRIGCGRLLVAHSDPITAAEEKSGWLAVNIACNDIAASGAKPRWALLVILLPETLEWSKTLKTITVEADRAARRIRVSIIGGHTEVTPALKQPLVVATCLGLVEENGLLATRNAKPGDLVLMTKTAGLEGTSILANDYEQTLLSLGVRRETLEKAKKLIEEVSIVPEALILAEQNLANSLHDPTEGGVLGGVAEIAYASNTKILVYENRIPVLPETLEITQALKLDPLRLISSGTLLATIPEKHAEKALNALSSAKIRAQIIGKVEEGEGEAILVHKNGSKEKLPKHVPDEIYRVEKILKKLG